jgi:hypothetical protein
MKGEKSRKDEEGGVSSYCMTLRKKRRHCELKEEALDSPL